MLAKNDAVLPSLIKTRRLTLSVPEAHDAERLFEGVMSSMDILSPWLPWTQAYQKRGIEVAYETVKRFKDAFEAREELNFMIKAKDLFVGMIGFVRPQQRDRSIEIGYWLEQSQQGRGYATEAANALTRYAFAFLDVEKVVIICAVENIKSAAVAQRLNFELIQRGPDLGLVPGGDYEKYVCNSVTVLPFLSVTYGA